MKKLVLFSLVFVGLLAPVAEAQYYGWNQQSPVQQWQNSMYQMIDGGSVGYPGLYGYVSNNRFYPMGRIEKAAIGGGIAGALIGAGASGNWRGAAIGGGAGIVGGALVGAITGRGNNRQQVVAQNATNYDYDAYVPVPTVPVETVMATSNYNSRSALTVVAPPMPMVASAIRSCLDCTEDDRPIVRHGSSAAASGGARHLYYFMLEGEDFAVLYDSDRKIGEMLKGKIFEYESLEWQHDFSAVAPAAMREGRHQVQTWYPLDYEMRDFKAKDGSPRKAITFVRKAAPSHPAATPAKP